MSVTQNKEYHCKDCQYLSIDGDCTKQCQVTNEIIDFDIETKTPCSAFHPADYIKALNFDTN